MASESSRWPFFLATPPFNLNVLFLFSIITKPSRDFKRTRGSVDNSLGEPKKRGKKYGTI